MADMDLDFSTDNNVKYMKGKGARGAGICMCWSSHWAKKVVLKGGKLKSKIDITGGPMGEIAIGAAHSAINVGHGTGRMTGNWYDNVFENQGLTGTLVGQGDFTKADSFMRPVLKGKGCYYFYITGVKGAHAMGLWHGTTNAFFDPNYGQYSCFRDSTFRSYVAKAVKDNYGTSCYSGWAVWQVVGG